MGKRGRILGGFLLAALLFTLLGCVGLAAAQKAQLNNMPVLVYDEAIGVEAYNINDNNYFKLRDVAQALSGGDKSFEIQYNNDTNSIYISTGQRYTSLGTELSPPQGSDTIKQAVSSQAAVYIDGVRVQMAAYNIDGYTYFKLRDLGDALDFRVQYDDAQRRVLIECAPLDTTPVPPPDTTVDRSDIVVMVDPGHGGSESGTVNKEMGLVESEINYTVAEHLGTLLRQAGYQVIFTRGEGETLSLTNRMNMIREVKPDLVISVHHNATEAHNATGAEVLAQVADKNGGPSTELAELINEEYAKMGQKVRPIVYRYNSTKTGDYYGLLRAAAGVDVTAVISEFAYMDNPTDVEKINSTEKLHQEAEALFRAVDAFLTQQ